MKRNLFRKLFLLLIAMTFAAAVFMTDRAEKRTIALPESIWPRVCANNERNLTTSMIEDTDIVSNLSKRWREGCPAWLCGGDAHKFIRLDLVCMKKTGAATYEVRAIGTAGANFGAITPLANLQTASAAAIIDFQNCTVRLTRKLAFKQPAVATMTGFFVAVGQPISIRDADKKDQCDHYRPPEMG
jgi:hypothetical protein